MRLGSAILKFRAESLHTERNQIQVFHINAFLDVFMRTEFVRESNILRRT